MIVFKSIRDKYQYFTNKIDKKQKYKYKLKSSKITNLAKEQITNFPSKKDTADFKRVHWCFQGTLTWANMSNHLGTRKENGKRKIDLSKLKGWTDVMRGVLERDFNLTILISLM